MDKEGRVLSTFTDIRSVSHLSIDSEGRVLVADELRGRILLLNSELRLERVLIDNTDSQFKLRWPYRLCYNELLSQLYVVHISDNSRLISLFTLR